MKNHGSIYSRKGLFQRHLWQALLLQEALERMLKIRLVWHNPAEGSGHGGKG